MMQLDLVRLPRGTVGFLFGAILFSDSYALTDLPGLHCRVVRAARNGAAETDDVVLANIPVHAWSQTCTALFGFVVRKARVQATAVPAGVPSSMLPASPQPLFIWELVAANECFACSDLAGFVKEAHRRQLSSPQGYRPPPLQYAPIRDRNGFQDDVPTTSSDEEEEDHPSDQLLPPGGSHTNSNHHTQPLPSLLSQQKGRRAGGGAGTARRRDSFSSDLSASLQHPRPVATPQQKKGGGAMTARALTQQQQQPAPPFGSPRTVPVIQRAGECRYNVGRSAFFRRRQNMNGDDSDYSDGEVPLCDAMKVVVPQFGASEMVRYGNGTYNVGSRVERLTEHYSDTRLRHEAASLQTVKENAAAETLPLSFPLEAVVTREDSDRQSSAVWRPSMPSEIAQLRDRQHGAAAAAASEQQRKTVEHQSTAHGGGSKSRTRSSSILQSSPSSGRRPSAATAAAAGPPSAPVADRGAPTPLTFKPPSRMTSRFGAPSRMPMLPSVTPHRMMLPAATHVGTPLEGGGKDEEERTAKNGATSSRGGKQTAAAAAAGGRQRSSELSPYPSPPLSPRTPDPEEEEEGDGSSQPDPPLSPGYDGRTGGLLPFSNEMEQFLNLPVSAVTPTSTVAGGRLSTTATTVGPPVALGGVAADGTPSREPSPRRLMMPSIHQGPSFGSSAAAKGPQKKKRQQQARRPRVAPAPPSLSMLKELITKQAMKARTIQQRDHHLTTPANRGLLDDGDDEQQKVHAPFVFTARRPNATKIM